MLANAKSIKESGERQLSSLKKSYEEEAEEYFSSVEHLEKEVSRAIWELRFKAGEDHMRQFVKSVADLPF
jgi:hypothetical protein